MYQNKNIGDRKSRTNIGNITKISQDKESEIFLNVGSFSSVFWFSDFFVSRHLLYTFI